MEKPQEICVVLLAAGSATRFGSAKQLVAIDGVAMVRRCALAAIASGAAVVVVTGAHREPVENALAGLALTLAWNGDWRNGMGSSLAHGVRTARKLHAGLHAVVVALADMPSITHRELRVLIATHARFPGDIVAADSGGSLGPPCLFPARYLAELEALSGERGARAVLERHTGNLITIAMPEAAIDIDATADYAAYSRLP